MKVPIDICRSPEFLPIPRNPTMANNQLDGGSSTSLRIQAVEKMLGYEFKDKEWVRSALTSRDWVEENRPLVDPKKPLHFESLEWLGDRVLNLVLALRIFDAADHGSLNEGGMTTQASESTDNKRCAQFAALLGLDPRKHMFLGNGRVIDFEKSENGREKLQADMFEALVGAIYLDSERSLVPVQRLMERVLGLQKSKGPATLSVLQIRDMCNWTGILQETIAKVCRSQEFRVKVSATTRPDGKFRGLAEWCSPDGEFVIGRSNQAAVQKKQAEKFASMELVFVLTCWSHLQSRERNVVVLVRELRKRITTKAEWKAHLQKHLHPRSSGFSGFLIAVANRELDEAKLYDYGAVTDHTRWFGQLASALIEENCTYS